MSAATVLTDRSDGGAIATVTLNRPDVRNAISRQLAEELTAALAELAANPELRAVIVTGADERAFSSGADLTERRSLPVDERWAHLEAVNAAADALAALPVPTIAAIRGFALAGGAELAIACDLRVAGVESVLGFPEVRIGLFPGAGGLVRLSRLIGLGATRDLLFTGRRLAADEALRLGLVERVVPDNQVLSVAGEIATQIAANAPLAVRAAKRALAAIDGRPVAEAHRLALVERRPLDETADYEEGLRAFAERRPPRFQGE